MFDIVFYFYGYVIFFYSLALILSYVMLTWLAGISLLRSKQGNLDAHAKAVLDTSPYTPGVSIVAGAYNEERTIVENVNSLLRQDYPRFEVVIANDGSTDTTLEKLIDNFDLVEVPFAYVEYVHCAPYKRMFKSTNPKYSRLIVVDKENGGSKADAINCGLNACTYDYIINTDVDCILAPDAIARCIQPILEDSSVIAVSGIMSGSNGCTVKDGVITKFAAPHTPCALFQTVEYMRSYLVGKMGWSAINGMPNVSGGYGLFDKKVVLAAGGYTSNSFAEDMDMLIRMVTYCCNFKRKYKIVQAPAYCCWTEFPPNIKVLYRQRKRWGRGLVQTFVQHRRVLFNRKYRQMGLITLPYILIFELLAPVIEFIGFFVLVYQALTASVNWLSAAVIFGCIYLFCFVISCAVIYNDYTLGGSFRKLSSYIWVLGAAILEPILYHPLIVLFSLRGYFDYITNRTAKWGAMTRKGFSDSNNTDKADTPATEAQPAMAMADNQPTEGNI